MYLNRVIVIITLVLMFCIPISICASTEEVTATNSDTQTVEERNIFEEFYYRLVLKDTRDFYDYIMLGTFVVGLLIVMIFQNTHYYTVKVEPKVVDAPKKRHKSENENQPKYEKRNNYHRKKNYQKKKTEIKDEN